MNIESLHFDPDPDDYFDAAGNPLQALSPVAKVTILVGANNSGKSRLLRFMSARRSLGINEPFPDNDKTAELTRKQIEELTILFHHGRVAKIGDATIDWANPHALKWTANELPVGRRIETRRDVYQDLKQAAKQLSGVNKNSEIRTYSRDFGGIIRKGDERFFSDINGHAQTLYSLLEQIPSPAYPEGYGRMYIPIVRGLRRLTDKFDDHYKVRTQDDYFAGMMPDEDADQKQHCGEACPDIFTGLSLYESLRDMLLGDNEERQIVQDYQTFLSREFFEGASVVLIPHLKDNVLKVNIGSEVDRPIHTLGDGLQNVIILSYAVFTARRPTWFFIEEPELHLHPGLQRKVLDLFVSHRPELGHQFFITTQSNHLLDMTLDYTQASVFTVRKTPTGQPNARFAVEHLSSGNANPLEELGVRNSSVFLVNATVWVEGVTDRLYLRRMLQSFLEATPDARRIEEDVHYCFVEYGGSNITHWSFLHQEERPIEVKRLCGRAMLIADGDDDRKRERHEELAKELGDRFVLLPCREVENLLPPQVIAAVVRSYETGEATAMDDFQYEDYQKEYLGPFIERSVLNGPKTRRGSYQDSSGTLADKDGFCRRALPHIRYESLPDTAKEVVRRIYRFIVRQNFDPTFDLP